MSYQVIIPKAVQKQLDKVPSDFISSLISAIMTLMILIKRLFFVELLTGKTFIAVESYFFD